MISAPPLSTGEAQPDEVEALLQAFFRAEMPDPWPAPPLIRATVLHAPPPPAIRASNRSKLALAASVALLLAGTLAIPKQQPVAPSDAAAPVMLPGEATHIRLTETLVQPKDRPTEWRIQVTEEVPPRK
jgi:hypothetical protein